ncbi:hypothetical protein [Sediminitomix flava]|uniref:Capsular polysaccharide biosynthesis protein n=1 Tax=Sediminitomix flava TaxID=379075 RepID=A0A315Z8M8_SEDFL|nr:hypothetical protein [Sediminitomix flava]PWJ40915.1 hypothetical protein BC781_104181 [Sediminitomix flava]
MSKNKGLFHLFWVQSHITYIMANSIIAHENLNKDHCVFMLWRGYQLPEDNTISSFDYPFLPTRENNPFDHGKRFWKSWKNVRLSDKSILSACDNHPFIFYAVDLLPDEVSLIINMKKCRGYYFMEEGLYSYYPLSYLDKIFTKKEKRNNWKWQFVDGLNTFFRRYKADLYHFNTVNKKYNGSFGMSEYSFSELPNKAVVRPQWGKSEKTESISHLIIFSPEVYNGYISFEAYTKGFTRFVSENCLKGEVYHYKFHPNQYMSEEEISNFRLFFMQLEESYNCKFIECNPSLVVENLVFMHQSNLTVYTTLSSLAFYTYILGAKVYSFHSYISDLRSYYEKEYSILPLNFKDEICYLGS